MANWIMGSTTTRKKMMKLKGRGSTRRAGALLKMERHQSLVKAPASTVEMMEACPSPNPADSRTNWRPVMVRNSSRHSWMTYNRKKTLSSAKTL